MDKRLLALTRANRSHLAALTATHAFGAALIVAQAGLLAAIVSRVHLDDQTLAGVSRLIVLLAITIAARAFFAHSSTTRAAALGRIIKAALRMRLLHAAASRDYRLRVGDRTGDVLVAAGEGAEAVEPFFRDLLPAALQAILVPLTVLVTVALIDLLSAAILLLTAPLIPLLGALIGKAAGAQARRRYADMSRLSAHFYDVLQGLVTLKLFNRSQPQRATIADVTRAFRESTMTVLRTAFLSAFMLELIATLSIAVIAVEIGLRLLDGGLDFGRALFMLVIAPEFYLPIRQLAAKFHASSNSTAAADKLFALAPKEVVERATPAAAPPTAILEIAFDTVSFAYVDGQPVLESLSFSIEHGEHVAIVGPSGAGKSTLAALLMRFIEPTEGRICVNGTPLSQIDPDAWRSMIAYMPQRPHIFNLSIADNVRLGRPDADDSAVWAALERAKADEFVRDLPDGIHTLCGENGVRFSGGQAHRIALARALLREAPLMVLDEPTAHLDRETERAIAEALSARPTGTTVIHIAHRALAIAGADRVIALNAGRLASLDRVESTARFGVGYAYS